MRLGRARSGRRVSFDVAGPALALSVAMSLVVLAVGDPASSAAAFGTSERPSPRGTAAPAGGPAPAPIASVAPEPDAASARRKGPTSPLGRATRRKLQRILRDTVRKDRIAGISVAIRFPGGKVWTGVAGHAAFRPDRPIEPDTAFAVASVSKTFVAALILQLAEEGKLKLDEPYGTYVRGGPGGATITIRELLSHTSGVYDFFEHPRYLSIAGAWFERPRSSGLASRDHRWTYDEIMQLVRPRYCRPGRCYHYSNTNYVILGEVAKVAGGAPLHELLRERFFDPLGMRSTVYQPAELPPTDAAHGHWARLGGGHIDHTKDAEVIPFMAVVTAVRAAGAIASTAGDLAIWADALYGGDVLSRRSLRQMEAILPEGTYGLGTDVATFAGHQAYGHRGGLRGSNPRCGTFHERACPWSCSPTRATGSRMDRWSGS